MDISNKEAKKVFEFALALGELMLKNGAETYRVEDTMLRILKTSSCETYETFVTPTGIFATLDDPSMDTMTYVKRVDGRSIHLYKVALANQLSRAFCHSEMTVNEAVKKLQEIQVEPPYPVLIMMIASTVASASFSVLFGGLLMDAATAGLIGLLVSVVHLYMKKKAVSKFFIDLLCGGLIGLLGVVIFNHVGMGNQFGPIIAGAIMPFVPGVAITNAIFDTIQGNLLSGVSRAVEAFIVAASLAVGIGSVLTLYAELLGGVVL